MQILRDNFVLISLCHFSLFLSGLCLILSWSKLHLNKLQASLALVLTSLPAISSAVFFSPINQMSASLAIFFTGLGCYVSDISKSKRNTIIETFLFIFALLCYEIVAPLLVFKFLSDIRSGYPRLSLLRIPMVFTFVVAFQKIIAPLLLGSDSSRIGELNIATGLSFILSLFCSIPLSLFGYFFSHPIIYVLIILGSLLLHRSISKQKRVQQEFNSVPLLVIALFSNSAFFILSSNYSEINSYQNRGMTCSWIIISVIIVKVFTRSSIFSLVVLTSLIFANVFLFADKLLVNSQATTFRMRIVEAVTSKSNEIQSDSVLIIDSHCVVPGNNFRIEVFCTSWDAKGALRSNGVVINQVLVTEDPGFLSLFNLLPMDSMLLYARFDSNFQLLQFEPINGIRSEGSQMIKTRANNLSSRRLSEKSACKGILSHPWKSVGDPKFKECAEDPLQYREIS